MINDLISFLNDSPTAFGCTKSVKETLEENGYEQLNSKKVKKGGKYYIVRNDTSIIALNIGKKLDDPSLHLCASHTDHPTFKLKPNAIHKTKNGIALNIEPYGGQLLRTWMDRPLSVAGRVVVNEDDKIVSKILVDKEPFCIIPNLAIHLNRDSDNKALNIPADITPIITLSEDFDFNQYLADKVGVKKEDILSHDLFLYPIETAYTWGKDDEFITSGYLDNMSSVYCSLLGFIDNFNDNNINVFVAFDNEEIGSLTYQGADSDFLESVLHKVCDDLKISYYSLLNQGMLLSFDVAQAFHPNHPEVFDAENSCYINKGLAVKFNANQAYTSDSISYALFSKFMNRAEVPFQTYNNKTGVRGGGTLGKLVNAHISLVSIDIGTPIWSMHSAVETGGSEDIRTSVNALSAFYSAHLSVDENNNYSI